MTEELGRRGADFGKEHLAHGKRKEANCGGDKRNGRFRKKVVLGVEYLDEGDDKWTSFRF